MKLKVILALIVCVFLSACRLGGGDPGQIILDGNEAAFAGINADTSTEEIAVTGGEIKSTDDRLTLDFPDGALATNTEISVTKLTADEIAEMFPILDNVDFVYELGPDGYTFIEPITVSYLLPAGADIDDPRVLISVSNGIATTLDDVIYNTTTGVVSGQLSHFSEVVGLPLGIRLTTAVPSVEHYVGDPPKVVEVIAFADEATIETDPLREGGFAQSKVRVEYLSGADFQPVTVSGSDRYVTISDFSFGGGVYTGSEQARVSFAITCHEQGVDSVRYRFDYLDDRNFTRLEDVVTGTFEVETEVTCIQPETPPEPEQPAQISLGVDVGVGAEAVKAAGSPPYDFNPEDTLQRFITTSDNQMTIFNSAGEIVQTRELFGTFYGAIYMQHSGSGDYFMAYGSDGKSLCLVEGGFCQIDTPVFSNPQGNNTTSAAYGVDANGNEVHNEVYRVRNGIVTHTKEEDLTWQEENVFDNEIFDPVTGFSINATVPLFAYEPLTPTTGIGISADGNGYFIDLEADTRTEFSDSLGSNLRDVECDQFSSGNYGCAIQSFGDATITACGGTSAADFSCGEPVDAGDGVSLGVAVTDEGNLAVVGADFSDDSIHVIEFTPEFGVGLQVELFTNDIRNAINDLGLMAAVGHVAIIPSQDAIAISGNGSGTSWIIDIDELAEGEGLLGVSSLATWYQ